MGESQSKREEITNALCINDTSESTAHASVSHVLHVSPISSYSSHRNYLSV